MSFPHPHPGLICQVTQPMIEGSGVIDGDDMRSGWGWEEVILPAWM